MSSPEDSTVTFRRVTVNRRPIQAFARRLQQLVGKGRPFDILITGDAELRRLNRTFRGQDYATDVLSFPTPGPTLGDLAISAMRARAQAREFGHSPETEIQILMLH